MSETERRCHACGGPMTAETTIYCAAVDGDILVFENVPAQVCDQCGARAYPPAVVRTIARLAEERPPAGRTVVAPVYDLAAVPA